MSVFDFTLSEVFLLYVKIEEMRRFFSFFLIFLLLSAVIYPLPSIYADELEEISKQLTEIEKARQMSIDATKPLEEIVVDLGGQIDNIQKRINKENLQIKELEQNIFARKVDLAYQQEILERKVRGYYKRSKLYSPFLIFLSSDSASQLTKELTFRQVTVDEDRKIIVQISKNILELKDDQEKLEADKKRLAVLQKKLDEQKAFFEGEIRGAKAYQEDLSQKIAELTVKQKALLADKVGTFQTSVGSVPLADDPASRPDFDPGFRPAFAAFSFGAPHRKGMSQYGAFGRAKSGQNAEDILRAYYGSGIEIKKDYSTSININVQGYGAVDIETYVKRIYEMPGSWGDEGGMEALKAQAVAARSYALAYTNNGTGSICADEHCQVYKPANKGGKWDEAVDAVRGWVLMAGGAPFSAWYASTAGGYTYSYTSGGHTTPGNWDTSCGSKDCWTDEAWEKKADSPWFYKGWYKSRAGASCGRSHPWLSQEEMADIFNAVIVYRSGQGAEHILPVDYVSCFSNSGEPWSKEQMKNEAESRGGAITSISGVDVVYGTDGKTNRLIFGTNRGSFEVSGEEFYTVFNLRAPGRLALKSRLFNIEKK